LDSAFAFIPLIALIVFLVLRNSSSAKTGKRKSKRIDFIKHASDSTHADEIAVDERSSFDSGEEVLLGFGENWFRCEIAISAYWRAPCSEIIVRSG